MFYGPRVGRQRAHLAKRVSRRLLPDYRGPAFRGFLSRHPVGVQRFLTTRAKLSRRRCRGSWSQLGLPGVSLMTDRVDCPSSQRERTRASRECLGQDLAASSHAHVGRSESAGHLCGSAPGSGQVGSGSNVGAGNSFVHFSSCGCGTSGSDVRGDNSFVHVWMAPVLQGR